jgi:hypothetical protein
VVLQGGCTWRREMAAALFGVTSVSWRNLEEVHLTFDVLCANLSQEYL